MFGDPVLKKPLSALDSATRMRFILPGQSSNISFVSPRILSTVKQSGCCIPPTTFIYVFRINCSHFPKHQLSDKAYNVDAVGFCNLRTESFRSIYVIFLAQRVN
jgi:hypothetical protein